MVILHGVQEVNGHYSCLLIGTSKFDLRFCIDRDDCPMNIFT